MELLNLVEGANRNVPTNEATYTGYHCTNRMHRCLTIIFYIFILCILALELLRSIAKDVDIANMVTGINKLLQVVKISNTSLP